MKNIYKLLFALIFILAWGCDKDEFAELNTNPAELSEADIRYLVTQGIVDMYSNDYTTWFYDNFQYVYPWSQVTTVQGGNTPDFVDMSDQGLQDLYRVLPETMNARFLIDGLSEEDKAIRQSLAAITYAIQIQPAITMTDNIGSLAYTEAGMAPYTNPPLLTPKVDNQELLFNTWLAELDNAITTLTTAENQFKIGNQDLIYASDYGKWAKFCNLLKLKIAARLVNKDRAKAIKIVEDVVASDAGYMDDLNDDFIYNRGIKYYGTGNGLWIGYANKTLVEFMISNMDPRVRFTFEKNHFNAEVVQAFIDDGTALPPYVEPFVKYDADGNFDGWNGPGEPWVRYYGAPISPDAKLDGDNNIYFDQGNLYKIKDESGQIERSYSATSLFSQKLVRTSYDYTYPTKPGGRVIELKDDVAPLQVILGSSAETNLYLAEFKLLGANLPKTAQEYFNQGVEMSVKRMDALAKNNEMPYYESDPVYMDADEAAAAATKLRDGEIATLLAQPAYDLGTDGLEKVYIQQYINFMNTPGDMWTLVRRSGIPKKGSAYLPWESFLSSGAEMTVPRRFVVATPTEDGKNYQNDMDAIKEQGFTSGSNDPVVLNTERLWFDKENPNYGEGPK